MRIVLDCRSVFPGRGGIGRSAEGLARRLPQLDHSNEYVLFTTERQKEKITQNPRVQQICFPTGMIDPLWEQLHLPNILKEHSIDLYHNPCFSLPIVRENSRLIATVHDVVFRERPELVTPSLREYLDRWTEVSLRIADRIITVSNYSKERIVRHYGVDASKIDVVYNGIAERFKRESKAGREKVRRKYKLPPSFVLYLGSIEPKKNIDCLLDAQKIAMHASPKVPLVIAGGKGAMDYDLERAIDTQGLAEAVIVLGYIEETDVVPLLSAARVFVYPSLYEGFGFPPLEAMACGTPAVVSDATCLPEIVADAAIVFPCNDAEALATAIGRLLKDKQEYMDFVAKGKKRVREFTWERCSRETLAVYRRVEAKS